MRKIKFRKWHIVEFDDYGNDVYGMIDGDFLGFEEHAPVTDLLTQEGTMQYTGVKDKKGTEIYEGDIVQCTNIADSDQYTSVVFFDGGAFCINSSGCDYDYTVIGWAMETDLSEIEVIGNVYENPEMVCGNK